MKAWSALSIAMLDNESPANRMIPHTPSGRGIDEMPQSVSACDPRPDHKSNWYAAPNRSLQFGAQGLDGLLGRKFCMVHVSTRARTTINSRDQKGQRYPANAGKVVRVRHRFCLGWLYRLLLMLRQPKSRATTNCMLHTASACCSRSNKNCKKSIWTATRTTLN